MKEFDEVLNLFGSLARKAESCDKKPEEMSVRELQDQIKIKKDLLNEARRNFKSTLKLQDEIDTLEYFLKGKEK